MKRQLIKKYLFIYEALFTMLCGVISEISSEDLNPDKRSMLLNKADVTLVES